MAQCAEAELGRLLQLTVRRVGSAVHVVKARPQRQRRRLTALAHLQNEDVVRVRYLRRDPRRQPEDAGQIGHAGDRLTQLGHRDVEVGLLDLLVQADAVEAEGDGRAQTGSGLRVLGRKRTLRSRDEREPRLP